MNKITLLTAIAMIGFTVNSFGQASATTSGSSTATIVEPLTITAVDGLTFGILDARVGGTITVNPTDNSVTDVAGMLLDGETPTAANFTVTGAADTPYEVLAIANTVLTHTDGTTTMPLKDFTTSTVTTLDVSGEDTFTVGATLSVTQDQTAGDYTGSFNVTVQYL